MARIFTIYFEYEHQMHTAMVAVRTTPFFTEFTLTNFNEDLLSLLPGNKILSRVPGQYIFPNAGDGNSASLMNSIIRAVVEHLHAKEV